MMITFKSLLLSRYFIQGTWFGLQPADVRDLVNFMRVSRLLPANRKSSIFRWWDNGTCGVLSKMFGYSTKQRSVPVCSSHLIAMNI